MKLHQLEMKIRPRHPNYKPPTGPIEIFSSSEDENDSDEIGDDDVIEISSDDDKFSSDDEMEVDPSGSDDDKPLDQLVGSRSNSTDPEVSGDDIDLDNVRWASSEDEESDDPALVLRGPNPMIPGNIIYFYGSKIYSEF